MKKVERNKYGKKVNALDACKFNNKWGRVLEPEKEYYHYHPDHLGSSSWITDQYGTPVQHIQYLPFGETWADQRSANWNAPYTYSGKEKDWETSYHYYGARYYDSDLSIWLSVDPLASKYPSLSPYVYCANNPIKLIDPDGRTLEIGDQEQSHKDILSIVSEKNQHRVTVKDGQVSVNTEGLSDKALEQDAGLSLINDLVVSDKKYYYEASDVALYTNEAGERDALALNDFPGGINASNYGEDSNGKHTHRPMAGFDGQVVISETGTYSRERKSIVFHELAENYYKTDKGMNYYGTPGVNPGAHQAAKNREFKAWGIPFTGEAIFKPSRNPKINNSRIINYLNNGTYR